MHAIEKKMDFCTLGSYKTYNGLHIFIKLDYEGYAMLCMSIDELADDLH